MASATNAAATTIEARIEANWTATPIAWPGKHFTPPSGPWIKPTILWGDGFPITIGQAGLGKNDLGGLVRIQVFDLPNAGPGVAVGHADDLRDLFNRLIVSGVRFGVPSPPRESFTDGKWQMHIVDIPFTVEETI